jgi:hypothetical protein
VKRFFNPISVTCLSASLIFYPQYRVKNSAASATDNNKKISTPVIVKQIIHDSAAAEKNAAAAEIMYDSMRLNRFGLSEKAFECAMDGYQKLVEQNKVNRPEVLTICDFSQSSRRKRMYIIDVANWKVLMNTYVAHGRNSGEEYATRFSNRDDSHQSSLGFYITRETYYGGHGLALKIDGLEEGINDNAEARDIVVHGSKYVGPNFLEHAKFNGRSWGCPAVPEKQSIKIINTIKNGSCLFIYHPNKNYKEHSTILNG